MKRIEAIVLILILSVGLMACGNNHTRDEESQANSLMTSASSEKETEMSSMSSGLSEVKTDSSLVTQEAGYAKLASPSTTGRLKVSGTRIVGQNGQQVQLRGISTHGLAWFPEYVNNQAFSEFRNSWGANVIRLAMYTAENGGYCTGGNKSQLLQTIYNGVDYATQNDMYVIIDWHVLNDNDPNRYKADALDFWNNISKRYAGNNNVIYEICNEPCGGTSWEAIKNYANEVIPVIRANDASAIIVVGTPNWSQEVDKAAASPITGFDNIMYTLHFYAATHRGDLQNKMSGAIKAGLPIMVTEFGICDASGNGVLDIASANQWINLMNANGVSYVCWNLSNKNESSAIIKASCSKKAGFALDDLSEEGRWLYDLLKDTAANGRPPIPETSADISNDQNANSGQKSNITGNVNSDTAAKVGTIGETKTFNSGVFNISMKLENGWISGEKANRQYKCTITNTSSSDVKNWSVSIDLGTSISLDNGWNGNYKVNGSKIEISSLDYNGTIKAGQSIGDVGFIVAVE